MCMCRKLDKPIWFITYIWGYYAQAGIGVLGVQVSEEQQEADDWIIKFQKQGLPHRQLLTISTQEVDVYIMDAKNLAKFISAEKHRDGVCMKHPK